MKSINFIREKTYECHVCGKKFLPGTRPDGLPNGVGMVLKNGNTLNFCSECIFSMCDKDKSELDEILAKAIERASE